MSFDVGAEIERLRKEYGSRLRILAHLYQRASVVRHADAVGDSLELARQAAAHREADRIVLCGVRFMAESAAILCAPHQTVFMPETGAGCPMANMANAEDLERALERIKRHSAQWLPVVYVNSSVEVKACCGRHGGSACTSSNAGNVFRWALAGGRRVLFLPDQHLGQNTAHDIGLQDEEVGVYDPALPDGGLTDADLDRVRVAVWKGFCVVHMAFTPAQVVRVRQEMPEARIIVHPECRREVVRLCDAHGSTSQIIRYVQALPDGATVVIGTEINLIERLADEHRGRVKVKALAPSVCANMAKTHEGNLLDVLNRWPGESEVRVAPDIAADARRALETMLRVSENPRP